MSPVYHCTVCGTRWTYTEIRYVARCKHCGAGLTTSPESRLSELPRAAPDPRPARA